MRLSEKTEEKKRSVTQQPVLSRFHTFVICVLKNGTKLERSGNLSFAIKTEDRRTSQKVEGKNETAVI